jgi:Tol biopolymer transport system component/mono/diheme cytochrome c family protein
MFPAFILVCLIGSAAVSSQGAGPAARQPAGGAVTFADTIAPIVFENCASCHRPGEAAPFPLLSYEDVAKRGALVAQVTASRYMPPWHAAEGHGEFVGERRLTPAQIAAIGEWVRAGMPRGDASRLPRLPVFPAEGWRLGQPDLVLEMPEGFSVAASGPDVFRNFVIPTGLTDGKWVRAIEYRPAARNVVHHALFATVAGGSLAAIDGIDGRPGFGGMGTVGVGGGGGESRGLGGWAVGASPVTLPAGVALKMPRGSDFLLQLHFHPTGKAEVEKSLVGIYFAPQPPERDAISVELPALFAVGAGLDIPAGATDYTIRDSFTLPADVRVFSVSAHAHYLGRQMKATATLPGGAERPLLWITDWDFNWQDSYVYKEPFVLPRGTRIDVTITYDNSADNPRNPVDPPRRARWGEQSLDEMGAVILGMQVLDEAGTQPMREALALRNKTAIQAGGKDGTIGRFLARTKAMRQPRQQLTIFDRRGAVVARVGEPGFYSQASFSPDGSRLAVVKGDPDTGAQDVWTFDIATGRGAAVTADEAVDSAPVWSPDGRSLAYVSIRDDRRGIYRRNADGTGEELMYQHSARGIILTDWSQDGRFLTFWEGDAMYLLPVTGSRTPVAFDPTAFSGRGGRFSPDGRRLAFNSTRSGTFEVYVQPFDPETAAPRGEGRQVSRGGVGGIFWRRDGRELFYLSQPGQAVMAVDIAGDDELQTGPPRQLFTLPTPVGTPAQLSHISSPDGQRFVFAVTVQR